MTSDIQQDLVSQAVAQGGAYEVIRRRLLEQGRDLKQRIEHLNQQRLAEFGSTSLEVTGRARARTEHNCIPRDTVRVGQYILLGYNVFKGLQKTTAVEDVFSLYQLHEGPEGLEFIHQPVQGSFLDNSRFQSDFTELYTFYKAPWLQQLAVRDGKLLANFRIGEKESDIRVFRWSLSPTGEVLEYLDNRGERDVVLPPRTDFDWIPVGRDQIVQGRHPHINILDQLFVDNIQGDITFKVENNTQTGLGIYADPVEDKTQSLDDAEFHYAALGNLILVRIKPYREDQVRHYVYNSLIREVVRIDELGASCVQLPEDHGIIYPSGYYLQTGELKRFDLDAAGFRFKRRIVSPNGEDVLYVFYHPEDGRTILHTYNLINKAVANPIQGHSYALFPDGRLVLLQASDEASRVHAMQIWRTPFFSEEHAAQAGGSQTFLGRIGNAELVRGISELYSIERMMAKEDIRPGHYNDLIRAITRLFDAYHWLGAEQLGGLDEALKQIAETGELILDEYEKVQAIQQQSRQALAEAEQTQAALLRRISPESWDRPDLFIDALAELRRHRGHLLTIRDYRYMDVARVDQLEQQVIATESRLSKETLAFLSKPQALASYDKTLAELDGQLAEAQTLEQITAVIELYEQQSQGLGLVSELLAGLQEGDATTRTRIIDAVSELYAQINQRRARADNKRREIGSAEAVAQFAAQFRLLEQSVSSSLAMADTPDRCDELLSRLLTQLQEVESQFSDYDQFLADILGKREEIVEAFEAHKQKLLDARQQRAQNLEDAANRILTSVQRRLDKFQTADEVNSFFASDPLILKLRQLIEELQGLDASVKADDLSARFKAMREQGVRALRDKAEIFEEGGQVIKLGPRHRFSVNTQEVDLTLLPRGEHLAQHLTGTDYYEVVDDPVLNELKPYWTMTLASESTSVYRAEYLAYQFWQALQAGELASKRSEILAELQNLDALVSRVRDYAGPRYREGYERGIHDHDAALILQQLIPQARAAGTLRYPVTVRAQAVYYWAQVQHDKDNQAWRNRARSAVQLRERLGSDEAFKALVNQLESRLQSFVEQRHLPFAPETLPLTAEYLVEELAKEALAFETTHVAAELAEQFRHSLQEAGLWKGFLDSLKFAEGEADSAWPTATAWLAAWIKREGLTERLHYLDEAVTLVAAEIPVPRDIREVDLEQTITGLLGQHPNLQGQTLTLRLDEFVQRLSHHQTVTIPAFERYQAARLQFLQRERERLRLEDFKARPLATFVRNKLINEVYLPIIGDNLAKQMGTVGDNKRSDLMGLLMLISPPGYGKTTLMEYVANRLGLVFMRINCPSLGHEVRSLDPDQAGNSTARQELMKLNLALEMGNNVMLYLDDIQHTDPEFLQKFISLCDATRRIEGVWKGKAKTYDLRGKKFCVVMAGNPYTETGETFRIPDMLANRADVYNLGDVLGGSEEAFALSYIENALTSNPVLAPLASRDLQDVYRFVDMAQGKPVAATEFSHSYSAAESQEIVSVLQKLFVIQQVILRVNLQYIASSAQADSYRTEPPFKLQGSYRNMNKMAEKVSSVMTEAELMQLIADHYRGEAQLLTTGAEENLLKLAELRGNMTPEQEQRWTEIKTEFRRRMSAGGDDEDVGARVVRQLIGVVEGIQALRAGLNSLAAQAERAQSESQEAPPLLPQELMEPLLDRLTQLLEREPRVEVINQPAPGLDKMLKKLTTTMESGFEPLARAMNGKLVIDVRTYRRLGELMEQLRALGTDLNGRRGAFSGDGNPAS